MNYYEKYIEALSSGQEVERKLISSTGEEAIFVNGKLYTSTTERTDFSAADYKEIIKTVPHLFLFGSGHIAKALYDAASPLNWIFTILDDRKDELTEERFPKAERIIGPYDEILKREYSAISPYYIIFTHAHKEDRKCLEYALRHKYSYIGMIGSANKVQKTFESLAGYDTSSVHAPIGLPINAVSAAEIAVSILAEIISVFRSTKTATVEDPEILKILATKEGIIVRIIDTEGSGPGKKGFTMLVTGSETYGTVGGGAIEFDAVSTAGVMLNENIGYLCKEYDMGQSGNLNMLCGGKCKLIFRKSFLLSH